MNNIPLIRLGVDLRDIKHHLCVLDQAGKTLSERTLPNTRDAVLSLAAEYPGARVAESLLVILTLVPGVERKKQTGTVRKC